ncbi:uncharacterized protein LOC141588448 [Silene latifolia]|uniref:uncharacterized protein LOC141588448 n=1 Tax=Silene latifolia TaxID=37657 RepID=UPI003D783E3E
MVTPATMIHLKSFRKLNLVHKKMIMDNSRVNQGPVKTFRMFKEYVRGYKNVGASLEDFKNFSRDVKKYIKEYDAEMLIEGFMQKRARCPSFYFDFDVDDDKRLTKVFWADPIAIKNYALFGDSVSFDTTFDFNEYRMVFCPFTGVDNHKKCVTFAAGLIMRENEESFTWLFDNFMKAMEKKCAEFYTPPVFYDFQEELKGACYSCNEANKSTKERDVKRLFVMDRESKKVYEVDVDGKTLVCSCKRFQRFGILWTSLEADCASIDTRQNTISELWSGVFTAVSLVEDDEEKEKELLELLQSFNEKLLISSSGGKSKSKKTQIETLLGSKIPTKAHILPPNQAKNKGSGRRMTSEKEKAMEEHAKPLRKCRACGEMARHDSRNCPSQLPNK